MNNYASIREATNNPESEGKSVKTVLVKRRVTQLVQGQNINNDVLGEKNCNSYA